MAKIYNILDMRLENMWHLFCKQKENAMVILGYEAFSQNKKFNPVNQT